MAKNRGLSRIEARRWLVNGLATKSEDNTLLPLIDALAPKLAGLIQEQRADAVAAFRREIGLTPLD